MPIDALVNEFIVGLYRFGREVSVDAFQPWALARLRQLIDFDAAMWRAGGNGPPPLESIHLDGQPAALMDEYVRDGWSSHDFLRARCAAEPGTTFSLGDLMTAQDWHRTPMYRDFACRYGIEWALCTHHVEPNLAVKSIVTLWRTDPGHPFTEADRVRMQVVMPHLVESMHANRMWFFANAGRAQGNGGRPAMGLCDRDGRLHDCSSRFTQLLRTEWPQWAGAMLPAPLVAQLGKGSFCGRLIDVDIEPLGGMWVLGLHAASVTRRLGARELQAARLYVKGLSYREIAATVGVAPATVRNQLRSSFTKLGVKSKLELARRLGPHSEGIG